MRGFGGLVGFFLSPQSIAKNKFCVAVHSNIFHSWFLVAQPPQVKADPVPIHLPLARKHSVLDL